MLFRSLAKFLPDNFDKSLLQRLNCKSFGECVFRDNKCDYNDYGLISDRGGHLFAMVEAPNQEPQNNLEMGGIS